MPDQKETDFNSYVHWAFQGILAAAISIGVWILSDLNKSVQTLNINMAVMVTEISHQKQAIGEVKERVAHLEEITQRNKTVTR